MTEQLDADAGYQGFISKNVLHKHWQVQEVNQHPWQLADFLEWIDLPKRLPKRAHTQGLGRNCTMFEKSPFWAYSQVLSYRLAGNRKAFADAVLGHCESINESFPSPLNFSRSAKHCQRASAHGHGSTTQEQAGVKRIGQSMLQTPTLQSFKERGKLYKWQADKKPPKQPVSKLLRWRQGVALKSHCRGSWEWTKPLSADGWKPVEESCKNCPLGAIFLTWLYAFAYISYQPAGVGEALAKHPAPARGAKH